MKIRSRDCNKWNENCIRLHFSVINRRFDLLWKVFFGILVHFLVKIRIFVRFALFHCCQLLRELVEEINIKCVERIERLQNKNENENEREKKTNSGKIQQTNKRHGWNNDKNYGLKKRIAEGKQIRKKGAEHLLLFFRVSALISIHSYVIFSSVCCTLPSILLFFSSFHSILILSSRRAFCVNSFQKRPLFQF